MDEARVSQGTYGLLQDLRAHYNPVIGIDENCGTGTACYAAQDALLDVVMASQPMQIAHTFLASKGNLLAMAV